MQDSPQLREEKKLDRRARIGCVLVYITAAIVILLVMALTMGLLGAPSQSARVPVLVALTGLSLTLIAAIGGLILTLRIISWSMEADRQRQQRGTEVLERTLPGLPMGAGSPESRFPAKEVGTPLLPLVVYIVGISIAYAAVNLLVTRMMPGAPGITSFLVTFALGAIWLILQPSLLRTGPPAVESHTPRANRPLAAGALYGLVVVLPTIGVVALFENAPVPALVVPLLLFGAGVAAFLAANMIYAVLPVYWIQSPLKEDDYDGALLRVRRVSSYSLMPGFYRNMEGVILLWAGRYEEAREKFQQSIAEVRKEQIGAGSGALENVGCALAWQGQYEEAIKMFEGSIAISPSQAMVYNDLAEAYLRQGIELPRALELTERAWKNQQQASIESRLLAGYQAGQVLATRAWALALSGQPAEAAQTLARALAVADKSFKPVLAGVHWRAGQAMLALGDRRQAEEHFAEGRRIDPRGHYGRWCAEALGG